MYVNPFWLGVLVTVVVEIIACIIYGMSIGTRGGDDEQ